MLDSDKISLLIEYNSNLCCIVGDIIFNGLPAVGVEVWIDDIQKVTTNDRGSFDILLPKKIIGKSTYLLKVKKGIIYKTYNVNASSRVSIILDN